MNERAREVEELEDRLDAAILDLSRMEQANEERLPWSMVERCHAGEHPLRVWREYRGLSREALAEGAGVAISEIAAVEDGDDAVGLRSLAALAAVLQITVDDLVPWRQD